MLGLLTFAFTSILCQLSGQIINVRALPRTTISLSPQDEYTLSNPDELEDLSQISFHIASSHPNPPLRINTHIDLPTTSPSHSSIPITLKARPQTIWRPTSAFDYQKARLRSLREGESESIEWEQVEILGPDIEDKHTIGQLARMTGNAYALPGQKNWYDVDLGWNNSFPFGWEDAADGFRGHVFLSPDNTTVVLSIKGTTLQGPTSKKDKFNDNLLFSCCCARVDISWIFHTVCDCFVKGWRCDDPCLSKALVEDSLFYNVGVNLINNLTDLYPNSNIWLVGHSLGGSLASLLGTTFGLPAVAFEAPGERLAAERLHLPFPPASPQSPSSPYKPYHGSAPVVHIYHNADPIPQGTCTGIGSPCTSAGFALETRCHLGRSIVYDTVGKLGWKVDVRKHVIRDVIMKVVEVDLEGGWDEDEEGNVRDVPMAWVEEDCVDCFKWEFGDFKDKDGLSNSNSNYSPGL
ncbi:Alpha/Beta hydrolase protein [Abortiporus biennis]|nr:Alpha/Beta hydrolase protein [Abortiporus biennis]